MHEIQRKILGGDMEGLEWTIATTRIRVQREGDRWGLTIDHVDGSLKPYHCFDRMDDANRWAERLAHLLAREPRTESAIRLFISAMPLQDDDEPVDVPIHPDIKQQWLAALRSGRYPQIREHLHTSQGYCCLGVLYDLSPRSHWEVASQAPEETLYKYTETYEFEDEDGTIVGRRLGDTQLTVGILTWAGLTDKAQQTLAAMNDSGASFEEIADLIEEIL